MRVIKIICIYIVIFCLSMGCKEGKITEDDNSISIPTKEIQSARLVNSDGSYPVKTLEKDVIVLKVVQTRVKSLSSYPTIEEGLEENMKYMEEMGEKALSEGKKPDIILFHEFPLTGYSPGNRQDKLKFTIQIPGPETERLGRLAKKCNSYVIFGSYVSDPEWPDHILSINTVIDRDGKIAKTFWKSRNIKRLYKDREITTTTVEAVRDKYRAKYGMEEEFPVLQTEFGNIAVSTVQFDPFIYAAFAMRGTEIMLRTATLFEDFDVMATAATNDFYSAMANFTLPEGSKYNAGESIIVNNKGKLLAKHPSKSEDGIIEAEIPIAEFRENRRIPNYAYEMVKPVFNQYRQEIPINHLDVAKENLPQTGQEMKALFDKESRFLNPKKEKHLD